jgi:5-methylthioadenosine/S-adenosylhomocysteine deaminase
VTSDPSMTAVTGSDDPHCDLLLAGGSVITLDDARRVIEPGAVAITGDRISAVGTESELSNYRADRTVSCTGAAIVPGFVDCHNHLFQGLGRGLGEGLSLWPWLCEFMWPYASTINRAEAEVAAYLGAIEAVRAGTTCVVDNHYSPADADATLAVVRAIDDVGLRGVVARGIFGQITQVGQKHGLAESLFRFSPDEDLAITQDCMEHTPANGRVAIWPAPINIIYVAQDLVRRSIELARRTGVKWHAHCSEASADPDIYLDAYGIRPIEWLHREGLLRDGTIAHAIWLDDKEVEYLGEQATGVSYNPISNQYLASGALRLRDIRRSGAVVGLGTDGPGCGHRQDMLECMKQAILVQRVHTLDPTSSNAEEALELATREGARYVGIEAGVLAPGYLADVAVVDLARPHSSPVHRSVAALAYSARGSDVVMTIVGGRVVYEDGRCTFVDEREVMKEAQSRAEALIERAGMSDLKVQWRTSSATEAGVSRS